MHLRCNGAAAEVAGIKPLLHRNVSLSFELKIAFMTVGAIIVFQSALDIDGMGIVPFDEIAVVAVHRSHEISERCANAGSKAAAKSCGFASEVNGQIGQSTSVGRAFRDKQRLHLSNAFAPVRDRQDVLFYALWYFCHNGRNII